MSQENSQQKFGRNNLSFTEILGAFPKECKNILPRKIKELEELLTPYHQFIFFIERSDEYDLIDRIIHKEWARMTYKNWLIRYDELLRFKKFLKIIKKEYGITPEQIAKARECPIEKLYNGKLKKSGNKLNGICPLHPEKTPSFFVYPTNSFYCFGCHERGDSISFVMKTQRMKFIEAIKYLINNP